MNKYNALCSCFLLCSLALTSCSKDDDDWLNPSDYPKVPALSLTLDVNAGTLNDLISEDQKYAVSELTLTDQLNSSDIRFLREMAGCDKYGNMTSGALQYLDIENVQIVSGGDYYYFYSTTSDNTLSPCIFQGCETLKHIIIPRSVKSIEDNAFCGSGLTEITVPDNVTRIGTNSFASCDSLRSVVISDSVSIIADYTFALDRSLTHIKLPKALKSMSHTLYCCSALRSVALPDSLETLGVRTFYGCSNLETVKIPKSVKTISPDLVFGFCGKLKSIVVETDNPYYSSQNGVLYSKDKTLLLCFPAGNSMKDYSIPEGVESLGVAAFLDCDSIRTLRLPQSLRRIEQLAFTGCYSLRDIYLYGSVPGVTSYLNTVETTTVQNANLYVPQEYIQYYKSNSFWGKFQNIYGL